MKQPLLCRYDRHQLEFVGNRDAYGCPSCGFYVTGFEIYQHRDRQIQQMIDDGVVGTSPPRGEERTANG